MAAIIQLRRGSSPSSLSYGEPYINDDSASLVVRLSGSNDIVTLAKLEQKNFGNMWIDGDITASSISASGDIRIGGQLFLGDDAADSVVIEGSLSSSLVPDLDDTFDIGTPAKNWRTLYIENIVSETTLVTSSAQITAFGFISESTNVSDLNSFTQSADQRLDSLEGDSGSYTVNTDFNTFTASLGGAAYFETTGSVGNDASVIPTAQAVHNAIASFGDITEVTTAANSGLDGGATTGAVALTLHTGSTHFQEGVDARLDGKEVLSSSQQITDLGFISESTNINRLNAYTASTDVRLDKIETATASFDGRLDEVETTTSSFETRFGKIETTTSSFETRFGEIESATSSYLNQNGDDVISGSEQITAFGFVSSSSDISHLNSFTSSYNTAISLDSANVTILGNLTVQGTQTTLDTATLNVADLNILVASGAADSAAADGAGLTIDGANESLTWNHTNSRFQFSDDLHVDGNITTTGTIDGLDLAVSIGEIESTTSSLEQRVGQIESNTGSYSGGGTDISYLNTFTASADSRLDEIEAATSSYATSDGDDLISGSGTANEVVYFQLDGNQVESNGGFKFDGTDTLTLGTTTDSGKEGTIELKEESNGTTATIKNGSSNLVLYRTTAGNALEHDATSWTFKGTTDSTSKTTGAVIIGGGLGVNNTVRAGGDIVAFSSSDRRLKDNIQQIENPLEKLSQISGNTFDWNVEKQNTYSGRDYGVIAQEIQAVMPELVDTRDNGYLAVKYDKIVPLLIESIKELKREIEELKSK